MFTVHRIQKKAGEDQEETCLTQIAVSLAKIQSRATQTFEVKRFLRSNMLIFQNQEGCWCVSSYQE